MTAPDVAVVGGGIIGTATAAFLAEAGVRVRLYERTEIAAGASGRNSGVVQHPFDPILADLYGRTVASYREISGSASSSGSTVFAFPEMPAGLLYVGHDLALAESEAASWAAAWPDARPEVVSGAVLRELEPQVSPDVAACRLAIGFPVEPAAATSAFAARARRAGVEIVVGDAVALDQSHGRVAGVIRSGIVEPAAAVVVAAGPWTPNLVDPTGAWRPIRPIWGVVAAIQLANPPRHCLEAIDIDIEPPAGRGATAAGVGGGDVGQGRDESTDAEAGVDFSLAPARGSSALGSTFLPAEPTPADWVARLRRVGAGYVPAVRDAPLLGLRQCARPVSLDGRPLVGRATWCDGLWIAAGHGPWGISTGPGTARLLADAILGRDTDAIPAALAVDRFGAPGEPPRMLAG